MDEVLISLYSEFNIAIQSFSSLIIFIIKLLGAVILPFILQTIIHELGHLIFGLITGYKPWFFRIFNMALIKGKGKYRLKICIKDGGLGQCLMLPQVAKIETSNKDKAYYPYALYNLGGIILNLITGILGLCLFVYLKEVSVYIRLFLGLNIFYGIGFVLINGLPSIEHNDGYNYLLLKKDKEVLRSYYHQLYIFYNLAMGKTYGEIPYEYFKAGDRCDLSNPFIGWQKIMECYYYMDLNMWDRAKACIDEFKPVLNKLRERDRLIIHLEELYLSIATKEPLDKISRLYWLNNKYMDKNKKDINIIRINLAYKISQRIYAGNYQSTTDHIYDTAYKLLFNKRFLYKGICSFTYKQIKRVSDIYK